MMLQAYRREGQLKNYGDLFEVIDQLDAVYDAFWEVSQGQNSLQSITMESLTKSVNMLTKDLTFLPKFKGNRNDARYEFQDLEKAVQNFFHLESNLQEATLDCVIAISKISMHLRNAIYADNQIVRYEQSSKAQKIRDEIKARKDYQEYLTAYMDLLLSKSQDPRMKNFAPRLDNYVQAMYSIKLEMT